MCRSTGFASASSKKRARFLIGVSDRGRLRRETFRSCKRTRLAKSISEQIWVRKSNYRRLSCLPLLYKTGRRQHRALVSSKSDFARSHWIPSLFLLSRKVPKLYLPTSTGTTLQTLPCTALWPYLKPKKYGIWKHLP
jgi:hypothetical protein